MAVVAKADAATNHDRAQTIAAKDRSVLITSAMLVAAILASLLASWILPNRQAIVASDSIQLSTSTSFRPKWVSLQVTHAPDSERAWEVELALVGEVQDMPRNRPVLEVVGQGIRFVSNCPVDDEDCRVDDPARSDAESLSVTGVYGHMPPAEGPADDHITFSFSAIDGSSSLGFRTNGVDYAASVPDIDITYTAADEVGPGPLVQNVFTGPEYVSITVRKQLPLLSWNDPKPASAGEELEWEVSAGRPFTLRGTNESAAKRDDQLTFLAGVIAGIAGGALIAALESMLSTRATVANARRRRKRSGIT